MIRRWRQRRMLHKMREVLVFHGLTRDLQMSHAGMGQEVWTSGTRYVVLTRLPGGEVEAEVTRIVSGNDAWGVPTFDYTSLHYDSPAELEAAVAAPVSA